ncbi:hypothetical protein BCT12_06605 [Vibrio breoganii]|nr:hypothetical protein BCT12_06605 [Vibrio breoganii]
MNNFETKAQLGISRYLCIIMILMPLKAHAYIGPGVGMTAIGTFLALLLIVILALVGFVWYPAKRAWKRHKADKEKG